MPERPPDRPEPPDRVTPPAPPEGDDLSTRAVHAGEAPPDPVTRRAAGAVVWHTAPFHIDSTAERAAASAAGGRRGVYSRYGNPTVRAAEEKLAALEGAEEAVAFASGMAALSAAIGSCVTSGDRIVAAADLYGGTAVLLRHLARRQPEVTVETVPLEGLTERLEDGSKPAPRLVMAESPSNPLLVCCDLARLARAAHARGALLLVDNTFASPALQNPLTLTLEGEPAGADLVVHSATKYLGGHSDVTGGFVAGSAARMEPVRESQMYGGAVLDPHAAFLLSRGMKTLPLRMERQSETAARLAGFLEGHPAVRSVRYPGKDPVGRRWMRAGGGMLTFEVAGGLAAASAVTDRLRLIRIIPSLGGVETGVSLPVLTSHRSVDPAVRRELGIGDGLLRLSVGIEAFADLAADLERALEGIE